MATLTIAYYTAIKYIRNPLTLFAFVAAPIIIIFVLASSSEFEGLKPSKEVKLNLAEDQITESNLVVEIVKANGALGIKDKVSMASMVIFLFYGALLTSHSIISDHKKNTHIRFKASPIHFIENFLGKSLGNISIMASSSLLIFFITKYFFQVNWNGNGWIMLLTLLLFLIIVNSFGIIVTGFTKNIYISALATFAVNFTMIFGSMSEAFTPIPADSAIAKIMSISFHHYTLKTIHGTIMNDTALMLDSLITLAWMALGMGLLALVAGRRVLR